MERARNSAAWGGLLLLMPAAAGAVTLTPVAKLDLLGGQYFFQGEHTSFSGNGNWYFSPGLKLGERDALIPIVSGSYRRQREVRELVGGGFLTAETLDNSVALKWVHLFTPEWNMKPVVSYKNELITESEDEKLGDGLFDYHKISAGVELERAGGELFKSVRQTLSAYAVRFYHYRALSASSEELGAEVNAGDRVLDFNAFDYGLSADVQPAANTLVTGSLLVSLRPYRDQRIVGETGEYSREKRVDVYATGTLSGRQTLPPLGRLESAAGLNLVHTRVFSNQNNYDATNTRFNPAFYDYNELSLGPFVAARWRKGLTVGLGYDFTRRAYDRRPIQHESGLYGGQAIRMSQHTVTLSASYPLYKKLEARVMGAYRRATSNMLYESTYRYNYWTAHYFAGLSWSL